MDSAFPNLGWRLGIRDLMINKLTWHSNGTLFYLHIVFWSYQGLRCSFVFIYMLATMSSKTCVMIDCSSSWKESRLMCLGASAAIAVQQPNLR
jgi:hypothetical protein